MLLIKTIHETSLYIYYKRITYKIKYKKLK